MNSGVQGAGKKTGPRTTYVGGGRFEDAPLAHRRPGYPSVGLLASRARLRFARQGEDSAKAQAGKEAQGGKQQEKVSGWEEGAMAASRKGRQDATVAPGGPELTVLLVTVHVP